MSARVSVTVGKAGVLAVKTATTPRQQNELAAEAERLRVASHPGLVTLVEHRVVNDRAELHTLFVGEPVEHWRGTVPQAAGLVAAVAATLADLHDMGLVHGRLDATHVLFGAERRPVLCGLSPPAPDAGPADDVGALGQLLAALLDRATAADRRGAFRWPRAAVAERRALAQLVAHATDLLVERRPTARAFARSILATIPGAELSPAGPSTTGSSPAFEVRVTPPTPAEPGPIDEVFGDQTTAQVDDLFIDRPWPEATATTTNGRLPQRPAPPGPRHHAQVFKITLAVLAVGAVGGLLLRDSGRPSEAGAPSASVVPSPATELSCAPAPPPAADVDGDGCLESVSVTDGVVRAGDQRWTVGEPDDALAVGDWDCDGQATPAAYRPTTGDVFVFSGWADAGQTQTEEAVARVAGGRSLAAEPAPSGSHGCDQLAVELVAGGRHVVEVDG